MPTKKPLIKLSLILLSINVIIALLLITTFILCNELGIPFSKLSKDVTSAADLPTYTGLFSNLGIFIWVFTAAYLLSKAQVLHALKANQKESSFLLFSGLFTLLLSLDDLFMLHESAFPRILGIPEIVVFALYGGLALVYLYVFYKLILNSYAFILFISIVSLALMVLGDIAYPFIASLTNLPKGGEVQFLIEDGFKLLGIVNWAIYYLLTANTISSGFLRKNRPDLIISEA